MTRPDPPTLVLMAWHSPAFGPRASLMLGDRAVITRSTVEECRAVAEEMGWSVERDETGQGGARR